MGIPLLNKIIREKCNKSYGSIQHIEFKELTGKTIVIDTSIYMYKFEGNDALIDNMYQLIMFLKNHKITPIFIFDGPAPPEKNNLLQLRRKQKINAQEKYNELQQRLTKKESINKQGSIMDHDEKQEVLNETEHLS